MPGARKCANRILSGYSLYDTGSITMTTMAVHNGVAGVTLAARIHRFGPPDVIVVEESSRPQPGAREVLVRVAAAGVGPWDALVRSGASALPQTLPLTLGSDLAGTIVAVGPEVSDLRAGDDVFGVTNERFTGAYAHHAVADASRLAAKPPALAAEVAASCPVVAVTAWQMLFDLGGLRDGMRVLIHGAGGAVGGYAVQLAHRAGARVIAAARAGDAPRLRGYGADDVIDCASGDVEGAAGDVDLVLDTIGGDVQRRSLAHLHRGARLISSVSPPDAALAEARGVDASFFIVDVRTSVLAAIAARLAARQLHALVGLVLPLVEARRAHELLADPAARPSGKIVLSTV